MTGTLHTILVSPLDWGLGHAARMIPVIRYLNESGHKVIISSYGESHDFLKKEFPQLTHEYHQGLSVTYPSSGNMSWHFVKIAPKLFKQLKVEYRETQALISKYKPSLIISDNRYNVRSGKVPSVIITHQTNLISPFAEKFINRIIHGYINKFTECWIPDCKEETLAGRLAKESGVKIPFDKIGLLSTVLPDQTEKLYDYCFIISGPEPQRSQLADKINRMIGDISHKRIAIISAADFPFKKNLNTAIFIQPERSTSSRIINQSKVIVSRSGYSTLMDLAGLDIHALFIPTPGQTEQIYLAERLKQKNIAAVINQEDLNTNSLRQIDNTTGFNFNVSKTDFIPVLERMISTLPKK